MKNLQSDKRNDLIAYLIIMVVAIVLFWRANYGFIWSDEPYYFETAYRFLQGDKPIVNDWYTAQIYSVLLVPYMKLWKAIAGVGFSGLFLFSRYLYVIIQFIVGIICYRFLRVKSRISALIASVLFMLYCRGNIATISYYSICSACLLLTLIMIYHALTSQEDDRPKSKERFGDIMYWLFSGILWGIVIICNPYLLILCMVYYIVLAKYMHQKKKPLLLLILMVCGVAAVGISFLWYIIRDSQISDIIEGISHVMSDESYYGSENILYKLFSGFLYIANRFKITIILSFMSFVYLVIKNISAYRNRISPVISNTKIKRALFIVNTLILLIDVIYPAHSAYTVGTSMAAIAIWGMQMYLLSDNKDYGFFIMIYVPGWIAALLMSASSDTHFSATTQGMMIAAVASVFFGMRLLSELQRAILPVINRSIRMLLVGTLSAFFIIIALVTVYDRIFLVYRDKPINQLSVRIENGPASGIITTEECARRYSAIIDTVAKISDIDGNLYLMNFCPWAYLVTDMRCSPYTAWRIMPDVDDKLGQDYYELHLEKFPDIVLRLSYENTEYDDTTESFNGNKNDMSDDNSELDYAWNHSRIVSELSDMDYRIIDVPCGVMYIRNTDEYDWITKEEFEEN